MRPLILALSMVVVLALMSGAGAIAAPPQAPASTCTWNGSTGNWSDSTR
jgi:hypothetical protein